MTSERGYRGCARLGGGSRSPGGRALALMRTVLILAVSGPGRGRACPVCGYSDSCAGRGTGDLHGRFRTGSGGPSCGAEPPGGRTGSLRFVAGLVGPLVEMLLVVAALVAHDPGDCTWVVLFLEALPLLAVCIGMVW